MVGIPPARDSDAEDVVWALQTAEALWKRNERGDAVVWLRRAAQAAGEANDDDRALMLARDAAELTEWMAQGAAPADIERETQAPAEEPPPPPAPLASPPPGLLPLPLPDAAVEPLATGDRLSIDLPLTVEEPTPVPPLQTAGVGMVAVTVSSAPPSRVLTAAEQHAGMLDPWSEPESKRPPRPPPRARVQSTEFDDEVVTSATRAAVEPKPPPPPPAPPAKPSSPSLEGPKPVQLGDAASSAAPPSLRTGGEAGAARPKPPRPGPPKAPAPLVGRNSAAVAATSAHKRAARPRVAEESPKAELAPTETATPTPPQPLFPPPQTAVPAMPEPPAGVTPQDGSLPAAEAPVDEPLSQRSVDLTGVEAFADLPDDARVTFAGAGNVFRVGRGVEVTEFALVLVLAGTMNIVARGVGATAATLEKGAVLRARGTLEETVPLGLVCASDSAVLATWDDDAVSAAFRTCPWVEEDLRAAADSAQAMAGSTLGELGTRLNDEIRAFVMARLKVRTLAAAETCAMAGEPIGGIFILGAGALELLSGEAIEGKLKPGDFLFPAQTLSAARAPSTARAGEGGALMLVGDRQTAQELFATQALLLEMFAGM